MEIEKTQVENRALVVPPKITGLHKRIIEAQNSAKYVQIEEKERKDFLKYVISQVVFDVGQKNLNEELIIGIFEAVNDELEESFRYVTSKEIQIAFKRGAMGHYDDVKFISPRSLIDWLRKYCETDRRKAGINRIQNEPQKTLQVVRLTVEDKKEHLSNCYKDLIEKTNGKFTTADIWDYWYDNLEAVNFVKFTNERKEQAIEKAKTNLIAKLKRNRIKGSMEAIQFQNGIESIEEMKHRNKLVVEARKVLVHEIFQGWFEMGIKDPLDDGVL